MLYYIVQSLYYERITAQNIDNLIFMAEIFYHQLQFVIIFPQKVFLIVFFFSFSRLIFYEYANIFGAQIVNKRTNYITHK